ncbi:uncharacterized protein A4U43_C03F11180 [Asparagus officinalis]|uniref:Uncharacterized protein n=1 Tax=Asparagus officinalis TaxID=4686 RepID=A0A5P1FE37_ASPOF|nr:uncharacterized protein A4U43_C03F11180 [Asparagus officinalis]
MSDFDELCFSPSQARLASLAVNRSVQVRQKSMNPSNLEDLFSAEIGSSPRYGSDQGGVFSPSHKFLHPINVEAQQFSGHGPLLHAASLGIPSPNRMSPRSVDQHSSPLSSRLSAFAQQEKLQQLRSLSSRDLGSNAAAVVGSPVNPSWSNWGSPTGKLDWGVNGEELDRFRQSSMKAESGSEEPDVSWVQSLVSPQESKEKVSVNAGSSNGGDDDVNNGNPNGGQMEEHAVLGAWLEQMQLDQLVA